MDAALSGKRILLVENECLIASEPPKQSAARVGVVGPVAAACRLGEAALLDTGSRDSGSSDTAVIDATLNGRLSFPLAEQPRAEKTRLLAYARRGGALSRGARRATPRLTGPCAKAAMIATVSAACGQGDTA